MFDIVKKFLITKELNFEQGSISLLGQRVVITPAWVFVKISQAVSEDDRLARKFYYLCKEAQADNASYPKALLEKYKFNKMGLVEWAGTISGEVAGWGKIQFVEKNPELGQFVFRVSDSPSSNLKGMKKPVDHLFRGMCAGVGKAAFNVNYDSIETKCVAMGDPYCEFILKKTETWLKEGITEQFKYQLFD